MFRRSSTALALIFTTGYFLVSSPCSAQDIKVVSNGSSVSIHDAQIVTDVFANTFLPPTTIGSSDTGFFTIRNQDLDTQLSITNVTISGTHSSDFSVGFLSPSPITLGAAASLSINFQPQAAGLRSAFVNIYSNDPDSGDALYSFAINGTGVNGATAPLPNLVVNAEQGTFKAKWNKKNQTADIKGTVSIWNGGEGATQGALVKIYASNDFFLDPDDALLGEVNAPPLEAGNAEPGTQLVYAKFKVSTALSQGTLIFKVSPLPQSTFDEEYGNNVGRKQFGVTVP